MTARTFSASFVEPLGLQVDIAGRAAFAECSQEHSAFQDELVSETGLGQASEERLEDVELQEFVDRAAIAASLGPQVEVGLTRPGGPSRSGHKRTSSAWRSAGSARGNSRASSIS